ncbi:hypothetical protein NL676_037180 [Syzygium grande]|nr:hypothetical protein NL676_037180 [Syzygium grande]
MSKAVAKGALNAFSAIKEFGILDHLDVPWDQVYTAEALEALSDASRQKVVIGGAVCVWGQTVDACNVQQTIWPTAAAAAGKPVLGHRSMVLGH